MASLVKRLIAGDFPFFHQSFSSRTEIMWFHATAEILTALSFYLMAIACIYFLWKLKDLKLRQGFWVVLFLVFMGFIHTVHLLAPWYPVYSLELVLKMIAAFLALGSAVLIRRVIPKALKFQHPESVEKTLLALKEEVATAGQKEKKLREEISKFKQTVRALEDDLVESEKEIDILPAMIEAFGDAGDFDAGLEITVRTICKRMDWDYAEAWIVAENGKVLEYSSVWYGDSQFESLRRASQDLKLPPDMGLGGRVWVSKRSEVVPDLVTAANGTFLRVSTCRELGLNAAFGVPVLMGGKVLAVLIFLMHEFREQDKRRTALISAASGQLGCLLGQK